MATEEQRKNSSSWLMLLKASARSWWEDEVPRMGASLAFYMIFAIAPLLVFAVLIAGMLYGQDAAEGQLARQLEAAMGKQAAGAVQSLLATTSASGQGTLATAISIVALFVGASAAFTELRVGLNRIWKVRPDPAAPWWLFLKHRALAFALVLFVGVLFLGLLIASSVVLTTWNSMAASMPFSGTIAAWLNFLVTALVETILFAAIFRYLPDGTIAWRDVLLGAFVTSVLIGLGNTLISLYFRYSFAGSTYGAAGSLMVLLLWIYYSAQVMYFGAEFTKNYAHFHGVKIKPDEYAQKV